MLCIKWLQNEPVVLRQFWSSASSIDAALKNDWMDLVLSSDLEVNFDAEVMRVKYIWFFIEAEDTSES